MSDDAPVVMFLGADAGYLHAFRGVLMERFRAHGYRVVASAAIIGDFDPSAFEDIGVEFREWKLKNSTINPITDLRPVLDMWADMREIRPDILFAHTAKAVIFGMIVARLIGIRRRVVMIPGLGYAFAEGGGWKRALTGRLAVLGYRVALSMAHMVIFQNLDDLEMLHSNGALPRHVSTGIVNGSGVDMDRFAPSPWPGDPPCFLMLARLLKDKGVLEFVEAARIVKAKFPKARFVLAGGTYPNPSAIPAQDIERWVAEGLIEAPGHLSDPREAFGACHVFVLPSFYREGCPRANLEAMAMGRAVVTTDWVGCRQTVIDGVTGVLVPPRDSQALGQALLTLAADLERAREMGAAGRAFCREKFELGAVSETTIQLIVANQTLGAS